MNYELMLLAFGAQICCPLSVDKKGRVNVLFFI